MVILTCDICGVEFEAPNRMHKYCNDCQLDGYKSIKHEKPKTNPNQKLIDDVRAATKQGMSYGTYKGRGI